MTFFRRSRLAHGAFALSLPLVACGSSGSSTAPDASAKGGVDSSLSLPLKLPPRDAGKDVVRVGAPDTGNAPPMKDATPPDTGATPPDASGPPDAGASTTYPAFSPNAPQVENFQGPVLSKPLFVPILFKGDAYATQIPAFVSAIGQSDYWKQAVSEYGVGAGTSASPIVLDETMPSTISDGQLEVWLQNRIGSDPRFLAIPAPSADAGSGDAGHKDAAADAASTSVSLDASAPLSPNLDPHAKPPEQAIYAVFLPEGTTVTESNGSTSCSSFGGYHLSTLYTPNGKTIIFAIIPRCDVFNGLTGLNVVTGALSHELAEATTDPTPFAAPAYYTVDYQHAFWSVVIGGGEVGDLCVDIASSYYNPSEALLSSFTVQRIWSNKQAALGNDPCRPALSTSVEPFYFNAVPKLSTVTAFYNGSQFSTLGIVAPPNSPTTLEVDLFSNASTQGNLWSVHVTSPYTGRTPDLVVTPTSLTGVNGSKLMFTVTNMSNDGESVHPFLVESSIGEITNQWIGVVTDQ